MGTVLNNTNTRKLGLAFVDDLKKPEKVQKGSVAAVSSDPTVATIAVDPSETFATITPVDGADSGLDATGVPVELSFTITADSDKGAGVREISAVYSCAVVGADATSIQVTEAGDTPKP